MRRASAEVARRLTGHFARSLLRPPLQDDRDPFHFPAARSPVTDGRRATAAVLRRLDDIADVYNRLADDASRALLLRLMAFRALGRERVALPPGKPRCCELVRYAEERLRVRGRSRDLGFEGWWADRWDLAPLGLPIVLDAHILNILHTFQLRQYRLDIHPDWLPADGCVVDGGACWGDTALFFAYQVGANGRVLALEFDAQNLRILRDNIALNPRLAERVAIDERALWQAAGERLPATAQGPGSRLYGDGSATQVVETTTIDALVEEGRLPRVDLIKLDVAGAEAAVLRGTRSTLASFRPRLAIAAHHRPDDLFDLLRDVDALELGYRFALRHVTLHEEETVLFAWCHPG